MMTRHDKQRQDGFTLMEILVAMTILAIIILIVGGVFRHSTTAWGTGTRKTELNMEGRTALDLMAQELSRAVASPTVYRDGSLGGYTVAFWTLGMATNGERVARRIAYSEKSKVGEPGVKFIERECKTVAARTGPYPVVIKTETAALVERLRPNSLMFSYPSGGPFTSLTNLPPWMDIVFGLEKQSDTSTIRAWSDGPPGGTPIRSWESTL